MFNFDFKKAAIFGAVKWGRISLRLSASDGQARAGKNSAFSSPQVDYIDVVISGIIPQ